MIRTDLALEAKEMYHESVGKVTEIDGVKAKVEEKDGISVTTVEILNQAGKEALGKEQGTYITIEMTDFLKCGVCYAENASIELKEQLLSLTDIKKGDQILVVGLGNRGITADALGSFVTDKLIVTSHLKELAPEAAKDLGCVSAIAPGVLGSTGMETADIIKGILTRTKPKLIIVIDALASRCAERIGNTVQISDTGIQPGSGIGNRRLALNRDTLGVPVIAIGLPTVIDAATIAYDAVTKTSATPFTKEHFEALKAEIFKSKDNLIVTPKDADKLLKQLSDIVSAAINMAFHDIPLEEISYYIE